MQLRKTIKAVDGAEMEGILSGINSSSRTATILSNTTVTTTTRWCYYYAYHSGKQELLVLHKNKRPTATKNWSKQTEIEISIKQKIPTTIRRAKNY